jgi:hypothetical protein
MQALRTPAHYEIEFISDEAKALIVRQFLTKREHERRVLRKAEREAADVANKIAESITDAEGQGAA